MLVVFPPNFGMDARIIYGYNLVAPLRHILGYIWIILLLFEHKIPIQWKYFLCNKGDPYGLHIFLVAVLIHATCSKLPERVAPPYE